MATLTPAEEKLLSVCKETIDTLIRDWSNNVEADSELVIDENTRHRIKDRVMVDHAIDQMWAVFLSRKDNVFAGIEDTDLVELAAYHHAVDTYFRLYRGVEVVAGRKPGRPQVPLERLWKILRLKEEKKTIGQMCEALGEDPNSRRDYDRVRKQLEIAEERCIGKNPPE